MNYKLLLVNARLFRRTAIRCSEARQNPDGTFSILLIPSLVNHSFSVELYLKYVLLKKGFTIKEHKIELLFNSLPEDLKREILELSNLSEECFYSEILRHSNIFADWRYSHEIDKVRSADPKFLDSLCISLDKIINEKFK